jgi:peptidyl-prolyl cis-trans isomerase D
MLVWVRKLLDSWIARGFFVVLIAVFVFWGVSNVVTLIGSNTAVAHVGGKAVDISAVQTEYQTALNQAEQSAQGQQPDINQRQQIASEALADVMREQVLEFEEQRLGVGAPDAAIRQAIDAIPAFQTNGVFDKAKFAAVLAQNNTSPDRFIGQVKNSLADRQLVGSVLSGVAPTDDLLDQLFDFIAEQRFAETVTILFAAQQAPKTPADAVLQRYWRNHPADFTAPQYRTIKLVILSPALLAPSESVDQTNIDAAYARVAEAQPSVAQRSVQVLVVGDLAASSRLQSAWTHGASWSDMQAMAKKFGATAVRLDHAQQAQIPSPSLGAAVFAATPGAVVGPVAGPAGMFVFKVTDVSSSGPDAETVKAQIKQQLQLQKAQADVAQDVDNLQDALAGQTPLDKLPGNIGLVALQGTLDANGNAQDGTPAPIPGGDALKAAVVKAAFAAQVNDPAQLMNGPDGSYFALTVDSVTQPALQPYDQVQAKVLSAWKAQEISREAEVNAADLLAQVNAGKSLDDAASAAGDSVAMTPAITRNAPASGVTSQMVPVLFSLKQGQATMQQTDTGFVVAQLKKIVEPTPAQDPGDYAQLQQAMAKSLQNDVGESFLAGLQTRDKVSVDQKLFAQIYQ